jgi:hypothetical protein
MTRPVKLVVSFALLGIIIGLAVGLAVARLKADDTNFLRVASVGMTPSDFSSLQFEHADGIHARQAVILEINLLSDLNRLQPDRRDAWGIWLTYARLGLVEKSLGNITASREAFDQAEVWYGRRHPGHKFTDDELKQSVKNLDQQLYSGRF